jgi:selenocysteine lyase/cysteine desulfurase
VYAVIDYDDKGVTASLRMSPHYYNTEEEIDQTVSVIRELLLESGVASKASRCSQGR